MKENESKEDFDHAVKRYVQSSLNESEKEPEYKRFHRIGPKIKTNGKTFQQIVVKFKCFISQAKVCSTESTNLIWQSLAKP